MPEPIRVTALDRDTTGWEKLWIGIAEAVAVAMLFLVLLAWLVMRLVQYVRK
jgi:ABC-type uncharacterized transport system permease subunit